MMGILALTLLVQLSIAHGALTKCYADQAAWAIDGYCLEIVLIELNWYSARNWCAHRGGDLAEIRTQHLQDSITQHLRTRNGGKNGFWIGATDTDHEGVWQWLHSPRQMGFTNWSPGQGPTDHGFIFGGSLEDCAMIRTDENYEWHDGPCDGVIDSFHYSFICQYELTKPTLPPLITTSKQTTINTTAFPDEVTETTEQVITTTESGVIVG